MASAFLIPQEPIADIFTPLFSLPKVLEQQSIFARRNSPPPTESLVKAISASKRLFPPPCEVGYNGYTWTQDGDLITVTFKSPTYVSPDSIGLSGREITSDFISGTLFGEVDDYDIIVRPNNLIQSQLRVRATWPILVCGGAMDVSSRFLLALAAQQLGLKETYEGLLIVNAHAGHALSIGAMAWLFLERGERDAAFYWNCVLARQTGDKVALLCIAEHIFTFEETGEMLRLNEKLLIALANEEMPLAFRYLGILHLGNVEEFNSDPLLAVLYFTVAGTELGDTKSLETLGKCYIHGIGIEADVEKGIQLLGQAGVSQAEIDKYVKKDEGSIAVPLFLAGTVVAVGAFLLFRRVFRGR
jgi:hypothetical protein